MQPLAEANKNLSYVPRIINRAADCYVRAKVEIDMAGECEQPLTLEHIYGLGEGWIIKDDYLYYTKILSSEEQSDLFRGLHIPEDWDYGTVDKISINVKAEAVQSANFKPEFNSDLPWGAVELKEVAGAAGTEYVEAVPVKSISSVRFDSPGGFQCSTSDLFDEFEDMMPGDCYEKTVNIKNATENSLNTYIKINAENSEFNRKLKLKILCDEKELYSGSIAEAGSGGTLNIAGIPERTAENVTFRVELPADADNSYAQIKDTVIWTLNAEEIPDKSVQTGDYSKLIPFMVIATFALLLMMSTAIYKRKEKNEIHN